jgi:hypothetical protein
MRRLLVAGWLAAHVVAGASCRVDPTVPAPIPAPAEPLRPEAVRGSIPEDARVTDWTIAARLDGETHRVEATARLRWTNRGPAVVSQIPFHLYLNAFRAADTAWLREGLRAGRTSGIDPAHAWGYTDVTAIEQVPAPDAEPVALSYAERDEPTLMDVQLLGPVAPGQTVDLRLTFESQLPAVYARTGFAGEFQLVGQWLPKPAVLRGDGTWADDPLTFHSEFFSDFGRFEVTLDVPARHTVGATGTRVESHVDGDRRVETYRADMVHHFAWASGPDLVVWETEHDGIVIRQLLPPDAVADAPLHHEALAATLDSMQARFGPYPWSTITVVHPPAGAGDAGGMEYPTLFTTSRRRALPAWAVGLGFDDRFSGAFVTVHEFGHQYFQGMLASNEYAEPWLDEGMNTTANVLAYLDRYADEADPWIVKIAGQPLSLLDGLRVQQRFAEDLEAVDQDAAAFDPTVGGYGPTVYRKTAATMLTLRALAGPEAFDAALRGYTETWRFRHPTGDDLIAALVDGLGAEVIVSEPGPDGHVVTLDVREYLQAALGTADSVDFDVRHAGNRPRVSSAGWHRDAAGDLVDAGPLHLTPVDDRPDDDIEGFAVVHRTGGLVVPVEIDAHFADGTTDRVTWDAAARHVTLTWPGRRLQRVTIDPAGVVFLEQRRYDNTAFVPGVEVPRRLEAAGGDLIEALALAILAGVGP